MVVAAVGIPISRARNHAGGNAVCFISDARRASPRLTTEGVTIPFPSRACDIPEQRRRCHMFTKPGSFFSGFGGIMR